MPYGFTEWEDGPEAQASSSRSGEPPRKRIGIGILDPPGPPTRQPEAFPAIPSSSLLRGFAALLLLALLVGMLVLVFAH